MLGGAQAHRANPGPPGGSLVPLGALEALGLGPGSFNTRPFSELSPFP